MKLSPIKRSLLKLSLYFEHRHSKRAGYLGLGQLVLLIALAPFIFDLSLYSIGKQQEVPSLYEYDASRFPALPAYAAAGKPPKAPSRPRPLTPAENNLLQQCQVIKNLPILFTKNQFQRICKDLQNKKSRYPGLKKNYEQAYKNYSVKKKAYEKAVQNQKKAQAAYSTFQPELSSKPQPLPPIEAKEFSNRSLTALLGSSLTLNVWRNIGTVFWGLGALLIIPAIWLSVRRRCWSLLICGLAVPAINYLLFGLALVPGWSVLSGWQITSTLAAQLAFAWLAVKGHISSKSFPLFVLLLSIAASWAAFSIGGGFSVFQAQLPIVIFVVAAGIARLVVIGVKENAYLFVNKGWLNNLRQAAHALLLWLPLAVAAAPLLYLTQVALPKAVVNQLYEDKVLQFPFGHDLLDNGLQSVAVKTDDAAYAWHMSTESTKRDIYLQGQKLTNDDLTKRVEDTFDQVMPAQLEFDEYESGKALVGWAIDLAVDASQDSTNNAFKKMRNNMKKKLSGVAAKYEDQFKEAVNKKTTDALSIVDDLHEEGLQVLFDANRQAQATVWWSINYGRTAHMLSVLVFIFVCLKSFFYVFSRVSFHRSTGTFVTLGNTENEIETVQSKITATGLQYVIEADSEETFYISRRFQSRGKAPRFTIPQPFKAPISRLLNGAYSMNKITMRKGDDSVRCTATKGIEFFEWHLQPDEVVLFDFYNFVGMSDTLQISTLISTRASSLLLGKMIHSQARGPGKLILKAEGRAEVTDSELHGGSMPPERIIATQLNTRFHVDSELDLVNVYLSTAYVRPAGGGKVIVDVDSQRGTKTGLGSFIKRFLLPI